MRPQRARRPRNHPRPRARRGKDHADTSRRQSLSRVSDVSGSRRDARDQTRRRGRGCVGIVRTPPAGDAPATESARATRRRRTGSRASANRAWTFVPTRHPPARSSSTHASPPPSTTRAPRSSASRTRRNASRTRRSAGVFARARLFVVDPSPSARSARARHRHVPSPAKIVARARGGGGLRGESVRRVRRRRGRGEPRETSARVRRGSVSARRDRAGDGTRARVAALLAAAGMRAKEAKTLADEAGRTLRAHVGGDARDDATPCAARRAALLAESIAAFFSLREARVRVAGADEREGRVRVAGADERGAVSASGVTCFTSRGREKGKGALRAGLSRRVGERSSARNDPYPQCTSSRITVPRLVASFFVVTSPEVHSRGRGSALRISLPAPREVKHVDPRRRDRPSPPDQEVRAGLRPQFREDLGCVSSRCFRFCALASVPVPGTA